MDGGMIPSTYSCEGDNISPQLDWTGAPPGTMSFAVFFYDVTFDFDHSAIWNIPGDQTGLPEDVEHGEMPADVPGALQAESYAGWNGYAGPCPPETHTYRFTAYALDAGVLDEIDANSSLNEVHTALEAHALATAILEGEYTPR